MRLANYSHIPVTSGAKLYVEHNIFNLNRPSVILLNGSAFNLRQWDLLIKPFRQAELNLIRFDYAGTGRSLGEICAWSIVALVTDLFDLISALRLGKVHLYGISKGTIVGQFFAIKHPELVLSLAGYGWYNPVYSDFASIEARFKRRLKKFESLSEIWERPLSRRNFSLLWQAVYSELFYRKPYQRLSLLERIKDRLIQYRIYPLLEPTTPKRMYEWFCYAINSRLELANQFSAHYHVLNNLQILLQHAQHDDTLPALMARELKALLPNASLIQYEQPFGHITPALISSQADRVVSDYLDFLKTTQDLCTYPTDQDHM